MAGMYINFTFAEHGVRFIAINDNFDTIDPNSVNNDFAGMEYIGATVNFKTYSNSIWDKKTRENPMEKRIIFYGTPRRS